MDPAGGGPVIAGLVLSAIPGTPHIPLNPKLIFTAVLPPLLYATAWRTSWREFRHNLISIVSVACGLVGFAIVGFAFAAQWLFPGFDWRIGVMLGAVAATAIASSLGFPRRIVDLLEGESLLNDATGLVALEFGIARCKRRDPVGLRRQSAAVRLPGGRWSRRRRFVCKSTRCGLRHPPGRGLRADRIADAGDSPQPLGSEPAAPDLLRRDVLHPGDPAASAVGLSRRTPLAFLVFGWSGMRRCAVWSAIWICRKPGAARLKTRRIAPSGKTRADPG